ncbi:hypothetical protein K438DRAFT_1919850 [Mycena galopus ATCC 62051]|nr:hypothetical protein K438DRAFT_1919850 [Mycena galopus ATCC 62051]
MVPAIVQAMRPTVYTVRYPRRWAGNPLLYISGAMASLGDALFGYSQGVTAAFQVQPNFIHRMYGKTVTDGDVMMRETGVLPLLPAVMVACLNITALFAALGSAYLSDYLGRRVSIRIGASIYLVASIIQMFAPNLTALIIGRMIQGLGTGILSTTVPIYQIEIAPANARGMFISLESFWMNLGYCASSWIGYAFFFDDRKEDSWRGPYGVQALISLLLFVWTFYLPETPRWLIQNDFKTEGLWTLADLHAGGDVTDPRVNRTYYEIRNGGQTARWSTLFKAERDQRLLHFLPETLTHAGFTVPQALFYSGICSFFYLAGTIPAILYVDKIGRRPFLLVVVGALKLYIERWPAQLSLIGGARGVVAGMSVYFFFFASTWGPIPWLLSAELFPLKIMRGWYYFVLVGCCIVSGVLVWLVFVETGCETLEEVGRMFGDEQAPPRVLSDEEDPVFNVRRRRARGHSTVSMSSQLTAVMNGVGAASQVTLPATDQNRTGLLRPHHDSAVTLTPTMASGRRKRMSD